jgi:hypothetical protein
MRNERGTDTTAKALLVGELSILLSFPIPAKEGKHCSTEIDTLLRHVRQLRLKIERCYLMKNQYLI